MYMFAFILYQYNYVLHVAYVPRAREGPECTSKLVCRCLYDMVSGSYPCCGGVGVCLWELQQTLAIHVAA